MNSHSGTRKQNTRWLPLELPQICERMIAFTIPSLDSVLIMSYEGLHILDLKPSVKVRHFAQHAEDYRIYNPETHTLVFNGCIYPTLGLHGGTPIAENQEGDTLSVDPQRQLIHVRASDGEALQKLPYDDYSGDWVHGTFSRDRRMILIGVPHALYIYRRSAEL